MLGYTLVLLDFVGGLHGLQGDEAVRCLSYLAKRIDEFTTMPNGLRATIVPAQYLGDPYPAIGLYVDEGFYVADHENVWPLPLEEKLNDYVQQVGLATLLERAKGEELTWAQVLESEGMQLNS
jgi:hypothetical protein